MARKHNPTARMVGMQRNPTGRNVEAIRSILKRYLPKLYSVSKSEYQTILAEFDQHPYDAHNFALVAFDKLRHRRKALIKPSKDVPLWYEHVGRDLSPLGYFSSRSAALKTLGDNLALSYELRGGTAPDKAALVKAYLEQADVGPLPTKTRNGKKRVSEKQTALFDLPAPAPKAKKGKKAKAGQEEYSVSACASTLVGTRWWVPPPPRARVIKCASKLAHTRWGTPMQNPAAASRISKMRKIVAEHQAAKVEGRKVDAYSASAYVAVYDALNAANKANLEARPLPEALAVVYKLISR